MKHVRPKLRGLLVLALASLAATPVLAAPYCVSNEQIPAQCNYFDPAQCQREAQRQNGQCTANPQEARLSIGYGKYCVVTAGGASNCNYTDQGSCSVEARRQNGACTPSTNVAPMQSPNPYGAEGGD